MGVPVGMRLSRSSRMFALIDASNRRAQPLVVEENRGWVVATADALRVV